MSSSKRPADDTSPRNGTSENGGEGRKKARDWRDAFLDDAPPPRRHSRSRDRDRRHGGRDGSRDRGRYDNSRGDRYGGKDRREDRDDRGGRAGREYHDRDASRGHSRDSGNGNGRRYGREDVRVGVSAGAGSGSGPVAHPSSGPGYLHREHERGELRGDKYTSSRRFGDTNSHHGHPSDRRAPAMNDREEGEIESPPRPATLTPHQTVTAPGVPPAAATSGAFRSINIPSQPRAGRNAPAFTRANVLEDQGRDRSAKVETAEDDKEEPEAVVVLEEETDPEKVLEERRRKREEIMARFKAQKANAVQAPAGMPKEHQPLGTGADSVTSAGTRTGLTTTGATPALRALGTRSTSVFAGTTTAATPSGLAEPSLAPTPMGHDFDLTKADESATKVTAEANAQAGAEETSAADYDPSAAGLEDRAKRETDRVMMGNDTVAAGVGEPATMEAVAAKPAPAALASVEDEWEEVEMEVEDEDEEVDMFAAFDDDEAQPKKKRKIKVRRRKATAGTDAQGNVAADMIQVIDDPKAKAKTATAMVDNVDDSDGYYRITPGEILDDGRYQVTINLGKGMFSGVVKAKVLKAVDQERRQDVVGKEVAIKVIRSQESMYVAGRKEAQILKRLNDADPEDKKHIVRMDRTFQHHGHLCIVTESLSMNLRDVIKRFGKDVGLNMRAVRAYAHQMFLALSLMRKCGIVHADIKPDNVLVSENKATLKVCDLGSAADISEGEVTPYLVSRFYRAPEIILGLPYDTAIDIWSIGCTLYELYTGKILFPGRSNNHMLRLMMEVKGKINHRLIKKATFSEMYFDESMNFLSVEKDKITGSDVLKTLVISKATRDMRSRLLPPSSVQVKMKEDELKQLLNLVDLLEKCLQLDPAKRITPRDALLHPFVSG